MQSFKGGLIYSAGVSGIGTLKGPLHGGANEAVLKMLNEIGSAEGRILLRVNQGR